MSWRSLSCISIPGKKSESQSFKECFGDHFRVFQYQEEKSEGIEECFGDHFRVFHYQGAKVKVKVSNNILEITVVYFNTREKEVKVKVSNNVLEITFNTREKSSSAALSLRMNLL